MDIFAKGTTFIIGPVAQIVLLHKRLGATPNKYGGYTFDCNQVQNLPSKASLIIPLKNCIVIKFFHIKKLLRLL